MIATGVMVVSQLYLGPTNCGVVNDGYHMLLPTYKVG